VVNILNRLSILIGILIIFVPCTLTAFNLQMEDSFDIPGLANDIVVLDFSVENENGYLEIAATDCSNIVIYSADTDEVVFSTAIDPAYSITHILFDDVNRDSIPDIIIGTESRYFSYQTCTTLVQLYDGASNYLSIDSNIYVTPISPSFAFHPSLRMFYSTDWNGDGYNDLLISLDSLLIANTMYSFYEKIEGRTYCYYSFPDSLMEMKFDHALISKPILAPDILSPFVLIATCHSGYYTDLGDDIFEKNIHGMIINLDGEISSLALLNQVDF